MKEGVVLSVKSYLKRNKADKTKSDKQKDKSNRKNGRKRPHKKSSKNTEQNKCKKWRNCKLTLYYFFLNEYVINVHFS